MQSDIRPLGAAMKSSPSPKPTAYLGPSSEQVFEGVLHFAGLPDLNALSDQVT